jgi:two-component system KDP operon response regulator KdpE
MSKLLLIDDDESLTELLSDYLKKQGHTVCVANDGLDGVRQLFANKPDLVILDVTMPIRDGWQTLERIREMSQIPVIMLTARDEEAEILKGFALGTDDYVTKPFSFAQLVARVDAVLARAGQAPGDDQMRLEQGGLEVDLSTKRVRRDGELISLTPTEFKLLVALMRRAGDVVSPEELVSEVWGKQYAGEIGHVRRYVWHLRRKIEPSPEHPLYIHNERGFGYRFQAVDSV